MKQCDRLSAPAGKVNAKEAALIAALTSGLDMVKAAAAADISTVTAYRWLKVERVREALQEARKANFDTALISLQARFQLAVNVLTKHMLNPQTPPAAQIRAASVILEHALQLFRVEALEERIAELERRLEEGRPR